MTRKESSTYPFFTANFAAIVQAILLIVLLFIGWADATDIVIIYALETVLIGLFHVFKMLVVSFFGSRENTNPAKGVGLTLFFTIHYGFFVFIQTTFFFIFLSTNDSRISDDFGLDNFYAVMHFQGVQAAALIILLSLTIKFFRNFMVPKKYRSIEIKSFMFVPYLRIVVQQFVAILPGFFIILFDGGFVAAILLILLRTGFDTLLNFMKNNPKFMNNAAVYLAQPRGGKPAEASPEEIGTFLKLVVEE